MTGREWRVPVGTDAVSAAYDPADDHPDVAVFICAHGAGGNLADRGVTAAARAMRAHGIGVVRFNFVYREKRSARPDPMPRLMATTAAVVADVRGQLKPSILLIGGRSMGGRAASMLAAEGADADGLLLLAYPLHPPGQPDKRRDAHLSGINIPVLCFNGTRDPFCTPSLMDAAVGNLRNWEMRWIEGADHSFHVLKSSGRTDADVMREMGHATRAWTDAKFPDGPRKS